jgi:uncharacterized protein (TIGR02996 family)
LVTERTRKGGHPWRTTTASLKAIEADPNNDVPRLVYADWLDEHDDPRATSSGSASP